MATLIVTHSRDNDAPKLVAGALADRGEPSYRLDTDQFPTEVRIAVTADGGGAIRGPEGELALADVTSVWYRRSAIGRDIPVDLDAQLRAPAVAESRRVVFGMLAALDAFVLDRLEVVRRAEHKPLQLRLAGELGLSVPRTVTTNEPEEVRAFAAACEGAVVTKMMTSFAVYREGQEHVVFTNPVSAGDLADLDGLSLCPMTFQEQVPKAFELRVVVVGDRVMAASVDSQRLPRARSDWRREGAAMTHDWQPYDLPADVAGPVVAMMDRLGLNYGALDFIVTPDNRHVFLEVNPAGEFLWLARKPGLPVVDALADVLTGAAPRRESGIVSTRSSRT